MKVPEGDPGNPEILSRNSSDTKPLKTRGGAVSTTEVFQTWKEELTIGSTFAGRYQIIEELGKGGMGKVYKVLDKEIEEKVALKLLNPEVAGDKKTIQRFRNELKLARKIAHRSVCRMFDLSRDGGTYYITMEYVPGEDLKSSIKRVGPLSAGKAILIAKQVCEGLGEAHRLGVVHRDLKPQNIMIDREGNARIMDFGIARSLKKKGVTETGVIIGSPEYMSVEQVEGREVDQRSDIYSLGIILYEMLTGTLPFDGDTPLSIAVKHTTQTPADPREVNAQIPEELSRVILKCMKKKRHRRYQSAEELLAELSNMEKDFPTTERVLPKRRCSTSKEITVTFGLKKLFIRASVLVAFVLIGAILWRVLPEQGAVPTPAAKPSLAILYFQNNSGDESLDRWGIGLSELLTADLRQSKYMRVLNGDKIFRMLNRLSLLGAKKYSSEDLKTVATQGGVDYILKGSFHATDKNFIIIVMLQNPHTGSVVSTRRVECRGEEEIFAVTDELTKRIKLDLGLSSGQLSSDSDKKLAKISTSSPQAYQCYIGGRKNYLNGGDTHKTIEFMRKATAVDPEFSMAYKAMAGAYGQMDSIAQMWSCLRKALELKDRLSLREFYLIQGQLYSISEETYDKAIKAYNSLLKVYPEDRCGNFNLGLLYHDLEEWDEATQRFEVSIGNKEETSGPYVNQAEAYMAMGMYDKARRVLQDYLASFPDEVWVRAKISNAYLCQGKLDLALREAEKALSVDSTSIYPSLIGDISHCEGDLLTAEEAYQKILRREETANQYYGRLKLAALYLSQGRFEDSKREFKKTSAVAEKIGDTEGQMWAHSYLAQLHLASGDPEEAFEDWKKAQNMALQGGLDWRLSLHLKGLIYLKMESMDEAQGTADELKRVLQERTNKKLMRYYHHLVGMLELQKGNLSQAIVALKRALSLLPSQHSELDDHALFFHPLAIAFYKAGELEKAQKQYKRITSLTTGRLFFGDIFAQSLYMLGKIYEEKGWQEKAREHYSQFLGHWKDADPGIPEVEDAKERLEKLRAES